MTDLPAFAERVPSGDRDTDDPDTDGRVMADERLAAVLLTSRRVHTGPQT